MKNNNNYGKTSGKNISSYNELQMKHKTRLVISFATTNSDLRCLYITNSTLTNNEAKVCIKFYFTKLI